MMGAEAQAVTACPPWLRSQEVFEQQNCFCKSQQPVLVEFKTFVTEQRARRKQVRLQTFHPRPLPCPRLLFSFIASDDGSHMMSSQVSEASRQRNSFYTQRSSPRTTSSSLPMQKPDYAIQLRSMLCLLPLDVKLERLWCALQGPSAREARRDTTAFETARATWSSSNVSTSFCWACCIPDLRLLELFVFEKGIVQHGWHRTASLTEPMTRDEMAA